MTPRYKTDATGAARPRYPRRRRHHLQPRNGKVLWEENAQDKRSIASITKVMTAVVFLEDNPDLTQEVTVERSDVYAASTTYLRANERITLDNLLHLTLIASDNAAARALARVSHGGTAAFVERMNEKALELGLESTSFADPSGLNPDNVSSAYDLSRLISFAASDERIAPIMRTADYTVSTNRRDVHDPQHQPARARRRRRRDGREDRLHQQGRLLPGDAAAPARRAITSRGRRARRDVEQRPLLGDAPPVQLAVRQGVDVFAKQDPQQ